MPTGLHALPEVPYGPDEQRIAELLVLLPETGTRSYFRDIERIEPGHVAAVTANGLTAWRHWQPDRRRIAFRRAEDYSEALRELLDQAVQCRLRGAQTVAAELSGGFDSTAVAATAARLLGSAGGRVIAFTAVPRQGYDGPAPRNRILDEGPYAAATAALYPNMEHVLIRSEGRSLPRRSRPWLLPVRRGQAVLAMVGWGYSIFDAVRDRKLTVLLNGRAGNLGLSYNGMELLPELFRRGRWLRLFREGQALVGAGQMRWRGFFRMTLGPWCPAALWLWLNRIYSGAIDIGSYSAVNRRRFIELDLTATAKARNLDLAYRPWKDGVSMRLCALLRNRSGQLQQRRARRLAY